MKSMVLSKRPSGEPPIDLVNSVLPGHIRLQSVLDVGGQGIVYRGTVNGSLAAVKVYSSGQVCKRIEREVEALKKFDCPQIVKLLWSGELIFNEEPRQVVATSLIPGEPLSQVIKKRPLEFNDLTVIATDVAKAIENMWSLRIVHRDLKPSNIILRPDGTACVIDLGVARHLDQGSLTALGATWGTLGYFSPEQIKGVRQLTCKSDLFALGVVLLETAMRRHPTNGDQLRLFAEGYHNRLPKEIESWAHASILKRMFEPQPTKRPLPAEVIRQILGTKEFHKGGH